MRARLKLLLSPDVDLERFAPDASNEFMFLLEAYVGSDEGEGHEQFQILVCSPEWLRARTAKEGPLFGRFYLVVDKFDFAAIEQFLIEYISTMQGTTWEDIASKLARVAHWEFEDYVPYRAN